MSDLQLTSEAGAWDLLVDSDSDGLELVTGEAAIEQNLRIRLRQFLGEWFLDTREGIPYFRDVFVKNPNLSLIRASFRQAILNTPGISDITYLDLKISGRTLSVAFKATMNTGAELDFTAPFIIEI